MATEIIMPRVDMDMTEGKIAAWYVKNGDAVSKGQVLFEIETDKATMEVDAPMAGTIQGITAEIGVSMLVGTNLGWIQATGEQLAGDFPVFSEDTSQVSIAHSADIFSGMPAPRNEFEGGKLANLPSDEAAGEDRVLRATPLARSLARSHGLDLLAIAGSGFSGRIQGDDVTQAASKTSISLHVISALNLNWITRAKGIPLVLLHGFGADHGVWLSLASRLQGVSVIGIDLPNHGKSGLTVVRSIDEVAGTVVARLDQEGVSDFHLLGHSMGGAVAMAMIALVGQRLQSLSLLAPAGLGTEINGDFIDGLCKADSEDSLKPWLALLVNDKNLLTSSFVATAFKQLQSVQKRLNLRAMADVLMPGGIQATAKRIELESLRIPTKVIWGTDDKIIPIAHARGLPARVALHVLSDVGHLSYIEASHVVAELLTEQMR